jgi:hypothetical protein
VYKILKEATMAKVTLNGNVIKGKLSVGALETLWDQEALMAPDGYELKGETIRHEWLTYDIFENYLANISKDLLFKEGNLGFLGNKSGIFQNIVALEALKAALFWEYNSLWSVFLSNNPRSKGKSEVTSALHNVKQLVNFTFTAVNTFKSPNGEEVMLLPFGSKKEEDILFKKVEEENVFYLSDYLHTDVLQVHDDLKKVGYRPAYPALYAIQTRAFSGRGTNSPASGATLIRYRFVKRMFEKGYMSPGFIEVRVWRVVKAAKAKHGKRISFEAALYGLGVTSQIGKAATVAVAAHLKYSKGRLPSDLIRYNSDGFRTYKEARDFLVKLLTIPSQDFDGVKTKILSSVKKVGKINVERALILIDSVHEKRWDEGFIAIHPILGSYHSWPAAHNNLKEFLKHTLWAFKARKENMAKIETFKEVMDPDKGILVFLEDSYKAGNCQPGTQAWMKEHGLEGQKIVPLYRLVELAKYNELAMNVVAYAAQKAKELIA